MNERERETARTNGRIFKSKMIKLRFKKPTMTERTWLLVAVVVLCLSAKAPRAFVLADDEGSEITTTEFGEYK